MGLPLTPVGKLRRRFDGEVPEGRVWEGRRRRSVGDGRPDAEGLTAVGIAVCVPCGIAAPDAGIALPIAAGLGVCADVAVGAA